MKYDVVIVGAGSAGCILAARLSENKGRSVLLLEAGPDYPDFKHLPEEIKYGSYTKTFTPQLRGPGGHPITLMNSKHNWRFVARATDKAPPMPVPRGKVTGGSSAINYSGFLRGIPEDFDSWASFGNEAWSFKRVLPYFRRLEADSDLHDELHGTKGPIILHRSKREEWNQAEFAFYNACRAAGFPDTSDHNNPSSWGVGPTISNTHNNIRISTALGYLTPFRHHLNLTIRPNCMVHRVIFKGMRAIGLVVESGGETFVVEGDQIILSAGAIGSPQLLMLSGVGAADQLRRFGIPVIQDMPGVGQNLRDHPKIFLTWRTKEGLELKPTGGVLLRFTASNSRFRNDMSISMSSAATERINPLVTKSTARRAERVVPIGIEMAVGLMLAVGSGHLRLASTDPHVQPILDYNYLTDTFDRQRLREAIRLSIKLAEHEDFRSIINGRIDPSDDDLATNEALDDWMLREVTTYSHVSCTCKMGPASDPMAVVDQLGRVHGLEGLRIVDASIMPNCVRAWINATVMMMAERIADAVLKGET